MVVARVSPLTTFDCMLEWKFSLIRTSENSIYFYVRLERKFKLFNQLELNFNHFLFKVKTDYSRTTTALVAYERCGHVGLEVKILAKIEVIFRLHNLVIYFKQKAHSKNISQSRFDLLDYVYTTPERKSDGININSSIKITVKIYLACLYMAVYIPQ